MAGRLPWDSPRYAHADVRVSHCHAFDNTGDPDYQKNHSGSGIVLYQVDDGVIEPCVAWNNGALCRSGGGGAVGLWTCASRRVVIQHCESFGNKTSGADGGGSEDCVLQYNYSHDNDGHGLMVYTYNATFEKVVLEECAHALPEFRLWVDSLARRYVDLLQPFRAFRYYHPAQRGSASMKAVLPTLTGSGYDHLAIRDGDAASREYLRVTFGDAQADERDRVRRELEAYCGLDTEGMWQIVSALRNLP